MTTIDARLVEIALENCTETHFELYGQALLASVFGPGFVPSGGMHDGGSDGFMEKTLHRVSKPDEFVQISKQQDVPRKLRDTVKALKQSGRTPRQVTLLTSRSVAHVDQLEETLSTDLGVSVRVRDRKWIVANCNASPAAQDAFHANLSVDIAFLANIGASKIASTIGNSEARTAYVFLAQEAERRRGDTQLLEAVTDSLVLWALEGTDPDKGVFRTRGEITARILGVFPSAKQFLAGVVDSRIAKLSAKSTGTGHQIRWHKKQDLFCLPHATRLIVEQENTEDEVLRIRVLEKFAERAEDFLKERGYSANDKAIADLSNLTVEEVFKSQGLDMATFLSEQTPPPSHLTVEDYVEDVLEREGVSGQQATEAKEAILAVLRGAFYESTPIERVYFGKLCRIYTLLLALQSEPRIVEYFRSMTTRLTLFIGSDLLVLALSEYFLPEEDQMVTNTLRVVRAAGAKLILCEPVLDEVLGQFRASDGEYRNLFQGIEPYLTRDVVRHADRILVRSYFYAILEQKAGVRVPRSWPGYVGKFLTYEKLQSNQGAADLRRYLCDRFGMTYESREQMEVGISATKLSSLAEKLQSTKTGNKADIRAMNDATLALCVYARRVTNGELGGGNPYGFTTWWLTKESRIRAETAQLVRQEGARFLMVPEFLLNFIALAPSASEAREAFAQIFPSRLGIRLSNRMREDVFKDTMRKAREAGEVDPERLCAILANLSDQLKGDRFRAYERSFGSRA